MICDISKHQGAIDWAKAAPELDFVVIKASGLYANGADPFYARNVAGAVAHGVPFHAYHFLYCRTEAQAKRDAKLFHDTVRSAGHEPLFWVLDCEREWGIPNRQARSVAEAFEAELRRLAGADIRVAVYIGHNVYRDYALDYSRYAYVWIPRYGSNTGKVGGSIAPDWPCDLWQYTSRGSLPGIVGSVDLNTLNGDRPLSFFTGGNIKKGGDNVNAIDKLIATAEAEVGYLEKRSNKDLDDKTANAGSANYTKYNRDMKAWGTDTSIRAQWCQNFVDWCFVVAFGKETAKKLLYTFTDYTPTGSGAFKKKGRYIKRGAGKPKRGDVIYFYSSEKKRIAHVGIVYKVSSTKVYTIEGNTSGASTLVTNGGGVRKKSYRLTSKYVDGYGSVDYSILDGVDTGDVPATLQLGDRVLRNYTEGPDVKALQEALISLGYDCGSYGADGEYGDCTEMAVRAFQQAAGCDVDGEYGPETHKALTAALTSAEAVPEPEPEQARHVQIETGAQCYIRTAPNTSGAILGVAHSGEIYEYQGQTSDDGWHLIAHENQNAWVSGKYGKLVD